MIPVGVGAVDIRESLTGVSIFLTFEDDVEGQQELRDNCSCSSSS
jgi:hypothetical protein